MKTSWAEWMDYSLLEQKKEKAMTKTEHQIAKERVQSYKKRRRYQNLEHAKDEATLVNNLTAFKSMVRMRVPLITTTNVTLRRSQISGRWDKHNKRYVVMWRRCPLLVWDECWYVSSACQDSAEFINSIAPDAIRLTPADMFRVREHGIGGVAVGVQVEQHDVVAVSTLRLEDEVLGLLANVEPKFKTGRR